MNAKLDLTKPVQTRNGMPVRIICTNVKGNYPIVGATLSEVTDYAYERVHQWSLEGVSLWYGEQFTLENVPPKPVTLYANVYKSEIFKGGYYLGTAFKTKEEAAEVLHRATPVAVAQITFTPEE